MHTSNVLLPTTQARGSMASSLRVIASSRFHLGHERVLVMPCDRLGAVICLAIEAMGARVDDSRSIAPCHAHRSGDGAVAGGLMPDISCRLDLDRGDPEARQAGPILQEVLIHD